ncbi:MAG: carbohydrate-binding family 6 protein, partial [Verrucomicrobiia bacterium]
MKKMLRLFSPLFLVLVFHVPVRLAAEVEFDAGIPQLAFAAQELEDAMDEVGGKSLNVTLIVQEDESSPEAYQIRSVGTNRVRITGTDANGAMYGGLEVADRLRLGLPIEDQDQKPFVKKRGVKINIPLDIRTPSFDDSGGSAQKNIETMWDFKFWKEYLDDLARYRYNVVSLWAAHPFPTMIKLEEYPDIAIDDVYYSKEGSLTTTHLDAAVRLDEDNKNKLGLGKKITIDEKIKYWQKVFQYAQDRGIEIMMVHWNVHLHGAVGKYGITNAQENPATIKYLRACVQEMLLTYPQITGIGTCAGENDDKYLINEYMTEHFVFNSYGKAVMDVKELQPDRDIRFIMRRHSTEYPDVRNAFEDYTGGKMEASVKYAVAHMYSSRRPQEWEKRIVDEGWLDEYKVWLNLRNDDIFMHRWGSPDYAREFIKWMPHEHIAGFYMGSDTYVWGREFISKNPEMSGRLEIDKHWYNFRLWGQLAYNNELDDSYWEAALKHRFPSIDA